MKTVETDKLERLCPICGTWFPPPSRKRGDKKIYCSRSCKEKNHQKRLLALKPKRPKNINFYKFDWGKNSTQLMSRKEYHQKKSTDLSNDKYIIRQLDMDFPFKGIPQEIIELKRLQLILKRERDKQWKN